MALGLQFFRALFLGGLLCPFAHDEQGGLFGDVLGYLTAALGDALPEYALIIGLKITGEGDMLVVERAFWVGVWVGLRDSVRRGDGLPGGRAAGLLFLDAGCAGLVTEIRTRAEVRAGGGGSVSTQDGQDGLGVETA